MYPWEKRYLWHPITPALGLAWFAFRFVAWGSTVLSIVGAIVFVVWFGLALYDRLSGGKVVRFIEGRPDDEASE